MLQVSMVRANDIYQLPMNWLSMVQRYDVALVRVCRGLQLFSLLGECSLRSSAKMCNLAIHIGYRLWYFTQGILRYFYKAVSIA